MPRVKKRSYNVRREEHKHKRRQVREEEIKNLQELQMVNQIPGNEESSASQVDKKEELCSDQEIKARLAKHAEYIRNYRKNMSEDRKRAIREVAARRMAQKRKAMSDEKKAAIRAADRLRISLKRQSMSEEEKLAQREYHRQRMAFKRKNMTEEQKLAAREADRRRVALKRTKWKEDSDHFRAAMLRLALQRQTFLPPSVDVADSSSDDGAPEDIQRFLAITLITGHSVTFN